MLLVKDGDILEYNIKNQCMYMVDMEIQKKLKIGKLSIDLTVSFKNGKKYSHKEYNLKLEILMHLAKMEI